MKGFLPRPNERVLFEGRPECRLPTIQTKTYGIGGPFIGAESEGRTTTEGGGKGTLIVTSQRIVVACRSDIREWPIETVVSCSPSKGLISSTLTLTIANHGMAKFVWPDRGMAQRAADTVTLAVTGAPTPSVNRG